MNNTTTPQNTTSNNIETTWVSGPTTPFFNDFIKIKQLGRAGQYGTAYQCLRKSDNKLFAVKFIKKTKFIDRDPKYTELYLSMMRAEIDNLRSLNHENIIKLESIYEDEIMLYIVMEECVGGELFERITQRGQYSEKAAAPIIKQLLSAVRYMHDDKGIVHCDLKPENILFLNKNEDSPIKIIDFGMSKFVERLQYESTKCGTIYYMAPELIQNKKYNHMYDMWTVGVILYVMIYGYPPFWCDPQQYKDKNEEQQALYQKIVRGFVPNIKSTATHGYGPWFPDHIETSPELRDLISGLLQGKARRRYTAKEALTHPWFEKMGLNQDINDILISRLVRFNKDSHFQLVISTLFRNEFHAKRGQYIQQFQALFDKYDTEEDGVWSFEEFEAMMDDMKYINIDKKYIGTIYQQLTTSPIGIDFYQLLDALVYDYLTSNDERLCDAFRQLDDDNDGQITPKQLQEKLMRIDPSGQWDKVIALLAAECVDPTGGIFLEEFLMKLHPKFEVAPEWIPDLFRKKASVSIKSCYVEQNEINDLQQKTRCSSSSTSSSSSSSTYSSTITNIPQSPIPNNSNSHNITNSYKQ